MAYVFGGNTGIQSPAELQRKRDLLAAMAARNGAPRNEGEGLTAIGQALAYRIAQGKASRAEAEGRAGATDLFNSIFSGGSGAGADQPTISGSVPPDAAKDPITSRIDQGFAPFAGSDGDVGNRLMGDLTRDFGLSKEQAAGVVGNLSHESGGFKHMQELSPMVPGSRGGPVHCA